MAVMAVTGDIGAGKSTAAKLIAEKFSCEFLNADITAKNLWLRDDVKRIAFSRWGKKIFDASGNINRAEIAEIIFSDKAEYKFCNALLHPLVMQELEDYSRNFSSIVLEIPLLFEAGRPEWVSIVIYIAASFNIRAERCKIQRGWSVGELERREKFLLPKNERIAKSDYVIRNDGSISELERQIGGLS